MASRNWHLLGFVLLAATACNGLVIDSCPTQRPAFTDEVSMSKSQTFSASLGGQKLDAAVILEFPYQKALDFEINSTAPISQLLIRVARFDESDASEDISGLPLSPLCEPPVAGVLFHPEAPQSTATAVLNVQDPDTILILDVTLLLQDNSTLFNVFVMEFVSSPEPSATAPLFYPLTSPTFAPTKLQQLLPKLTVLEYEPPPVSSSVSFVVESEWKEDSSTSRKKGSDAQRRKKGEVHQRKVTRGNMARENGESSKIRRGV